MAITATNLLGSGDLTDGTVYVTASVNLVAGRLYLLTVQGRRSTASAASAPTVTGASQTWAQVDTHQLSTATRFRTTIFRCQPTANASGALTITFPETQSIAGWVLDEFTGAQLGNNGANAIVQCEDDEQVGGTSYSDTLAAFTFSGNATYLVADLGSTASNVTEEGSYTQLSDFALPSEAGDSRMFSEYLASPDTSPSFTWTTSSNVNGAFALELAAYSPRNRGVLVADVGVASL